VNNKIFSIGIFFFILYWVAFLYKPFLMTITVAILLAIATANINNYIRKKSKNRYLSATISTLLLAVLFFGPLIYFVTSLALFLNNIHTEDIASMINVIKSHKDSIISDIPFLQDRISSFLSEFNAADITKYLLQGATFFGKISAGFLKDIFLVTVFYFFINLYSKDLVAYIRSVLFLSKSELDMIFSEIVNVMSVVFFSIIVTAAFEGVLFAGISYYYGYDWLLLGILYGFASMIPVIGGTIMWGPLSLYAYSQGHTFEAMVIVLYSIIVISIIADTFIKPVIIMYVNEKLLQVPAKINELLIFFSIIAGLSTFGFWGMILGPAITTFLLSYLKILKAMKEGDSIIW
jgi:predicted PurR-regulated permease PerM